MGLKIVCSGSMIRLPVGGFVWHHFQYVAGLIRLGHEVTYFEDYGWPDSCYQPSSDVSSSDPTFGIACLRELLRKYELSCALCYLAEDGTAQFEPYFDLPASSGEPMEIAINIRAKFANPKHVRGRLTCGGWHVRNPAEVTQTPWAYQRYLRESRAEFSVSKHGYVVTQCGWFSERSAAYLASGRPVILQDTGFSNVLPCGEGLLAYKDRTGAIAAMDDVSENYEAHCRRARAIAEEFFDSRRVLTRLLEQTCESA